MSNFCSQCGTKLESDYTFCPNCGYSIEREETATSQFKTPPSPPIKTISPQNSTFDGHSWEKNAEYTTDGKALFGMKISKKEKTSAILWLIGAIVDLVVFLCLLALFASGSIIGDYDRFMDGFKLILSIIIGVWYISLAVSRFRRSKLAKNPTTNLIYDYKSRKSNCIALLVVNIVLVGGLVSWIGIAASIIDLITRNYVVQNAPFYSIDDKENLEKKRPNWVCAYCGEQNLGEDSFCKKCKQYKKTKILHNSSSSWICSYCDTENSAEDTFCQNCKQYKCENKDSTEIYK